MPVSPADPADDVPARFQVDFTGRLLLGLYRVERRLADGGMGSVYLAEDTNLGRRVVVKVPHARFLGEPGFRARFRREMEELVRLEHPHVVRILARGEEDGVPFFVLQYLGGGSLEDRLARGPQTAAEASGWLGTIAETLDFVHTRGVVHRDVKPANILFDDEGHVFLSDFGVVKALGKEDGADLTAVGTGIGSPVYMAPEQTTGRGVSPASDQYALASTLYEALAGQPPFGKASVVEVLVRKGREDAPLLRTLVPALPAACEGAVARALAREPAARFASCSELARAFGEGLAPAPAAAPPRARTPLLVATLLFVAAVTAATLTRGFGLWASEPAPSPSTPAAGKARPGDSPMLVRVLEPGAEPRTRLAWSFTAGTREARRGVRKEHMKQELGTKPPVVLTTTTEEQLEAHVDEVDAQGVARIAWTFPPEVAVVDDGAVPETVEEARKLNEALGTVSGTSRLSPAGAVLEISLKAERESKSPELEPIRQYEEMIRVLAVPLPTIPVGRGAKWQATQIKSMFVEYQQTYTFEVLELDGRRLRLAYRFEQDAPPQGLAAAGLSEEGKSAVISLVSSGAGECVLDLERALPLSYSVKGSFSYAVEAPGKPDSPFRLELTFEGTMTER